MSLIGAPGNGASAALASKASTSAATALGANGERSEVASDQNKEYQVKAAFLFNFISYTTWPKESLPAEDKPLVVAVIGPNPFGTGLEALLKGKKAHNRNLEAVYYASMPEKFDAHIVFCAHADPTFREALLKRTQNQAMLLIGEHAGFSLAGAHISFYIDDGKVRFEVNLDALRKSNLIMSSQLLKLAKIVKKYAS